MTVTDLLGSCPLAAFKSEWVAGLVSEWVAAFKSEWVAGLIGIRILAQNFLNRLVTDKKLNNEH